MLRLTLTLVDVSLNQLSGGIPTQRVFYCIIQPMPDTMQVDQTQQGQ